MCGIAGAWHRRARAVGNALAEQARAMAATLDHRGPDASDIWCNVDAGLAFGHTRLSIIDLSPAGAQPMASSCGRFVLSYNGEIYNAAELRAPLIEAGRRFRGHSDTEVIVEGAAVWGVEAVIAKLIGMFALSLWDRQERALYLVRDRLGIKPLYWGEFGDLLLFGSELKALRAHPGFAAALDRDALAGFLRTGYILQPRTIYRGVSKLPPGMILKLKHEGAPELRPFWRLDAVARDGQAARFSGGEREAVDRLDDLLGDAVERRMVADVPLGAFLSGGIDSSTVVALMQARSGRKVRSFSIGFGEPGYDEAPHAAAVARHLGTEHTEMYVSADDARAVIPLLPEIYDEPFADPSQIPTYLLSKLTRQHVTVALSGDGGDEVFGGYTRYSQARLLARIGRVPGPARALARAAIRSLSPQRWSSLAQLAPGGRLPPQLGDKLYKLASVLEGGSEEYYRRLTTHWENPASLLQGGDASEPRTILDDPRAAALVPDPLERMQLFDTATYLPDDILTKVDRASMAVSLEVRVPILDHRVVAFSWQLPGAMKARDGTSKWILRQVLYRYVPRALVERPKMGFGVPIDAWLRGPLRGWAENLLGERRLAAEGVLDPAPIRRRWQEHLAGARNWQYALWNVLMFQAWKERWMA